VHAEQAQVAELLGQLPGQLAALEPAGDLGQDAVGDKAAGGVADQPLLLAEQLVEVEEVK
jgi:hypothetical protein